MNTIKYQMNLTLLDNTVLKTYSTDVNNDILTLKFLKSDITKNQLSHIFSPSNIENYKKIYKTTTAGKYVCDFKNYIKVVSIAEALENISVVTENIISTAIESEDGTEVIPGYTTVEDITEVPTDIVIVVLEYVSPMEQRLDMLSEKVSPTINVDTCTLEELQNYVQEQNKQALAKFLADNPLKWTDGEYYGVKQEDQLEMALDLSAYQVKVLIDPNWKLEWHNIKKSCREFTLEEYNSLMSAIIDYVYPYRRLQEQRKESIFNAKTKDEILSIELIYKLDKKSEE